MNEGCLVCAVEVSIEKDSELYDKMLDIVELSGMPIEAVVEVLVNTGFKDHAGGNADVWLKLLKNKKAPLGKRDA